MLSDCTGASSKPLFYLRPGPVAHPENGVTSCTHDDIARQGRCPQARSVESIVDTVTDFWRSRILSARDDEGRTLNRTAFGFDPDIRQVSKRYWAGIGNWLNGTSSLGRCEENDCPLQAALKRAKRGGCRNKTRHPTRLSGA